jgi:hypothetical protein
MNTSSVRDLDFAALRQRAFQPSPAACEDQVLYFLLLDRFSDGHENGFRALDGSVVTDGTTPLFSASDAGNAIGSDTDAARWREAGGRFCGGTLRGLTSKLGYLRRLGITALWISPLFKQVAFDHGSYHGYGIQDFLDVDPRFGTAGDLRTMVAAAHAQGIYVILDIILNHAGDVFAYEGGATPFWNGSVYPVAGYRDATGLPAGAVRNATAVRPGLARWRGVAEGTATGGHVQPPGKNQELGL